MILFDLHDEILSEEQLDDQFIKRILQAKEDLIEGDRLKQKQWLFR